MLPLELRSEEQYIVTLLPLNTATFCGFIASAHSTPATKLKTLLWTDAADYSA